MSVQCIARRLQRGFSRQSGTSACPSRRLITASSRLTHLILLLIELAVRMNREGKSPMSMGAPNKSRACIASCCQACAISNPKIFQRSLATPSDFRGLSPSPFAERFRHVNLLSDAQKTFHAFPDTRGTLSRWGEPVGVRSQSDFHSSRTRHSRR